jgi:hypothetical protein
LSSRIGNAQPERRDDGRHQGKTGERIESPGKAAGIILRPADHGRSEEVAEIATELIQAIPDAAAVPVEIIAGWLGRKTLNFLASFCQKTFLVLDNSIDCFACTEDWFPCLC